MLAPDMRATGTCFLRSHKIERVIVFVFRGSQSLFKEAIIFIKHPRNVSFLELIGWILSSLFFVSRIHPRDRQSTQQPETTVPQQKMH